VKPSGPDKIREPCAQVAAGKANEDLLVELDQALREHSEGLRERYSAYPPQAERRHRA
jgi:hypothetical protein